VPELAGEPLVVVQARGVVIHSQTTDLFVPEICTVTQAHVKRHQAVISVAVVKERAEHQVDNVQCLPAVINVTKLKNVILIEL
jgi:hypothetical protein